jgi:glutamine synthetase
MAYKAEYIWIDGTQPTAKLRSKTKIVEDGVNPGDLPIWGFDGSSTNQAPGDKSDCVLQPVFTCPDPIRGGGNLLVLCEVLYIDMTPHVTNTRAKCVEVATRYADQESVFGIEQEYTFFKDGRPYGFPFGGFPAPQGGYYCGVGDDEVYGRDVVEAHLDACLAAGLHISGINAEVMPGQWEFQVGPVAAPQVADELWIARWLLYRIGEDFGVSATLDPKPVKGDWNGAGAHTNFSTKAMREGYDPIIAACEALGTRVEDCIRLYGHGIEDRLTGQHETAPYTEYSYGVSNRGASVRIPWQVEVDKKGYIEDRRPNANCDPYEVTMIIIDTVCAALA